MYCQYSFADIYENLYNMLLYICIVKIILWMCHYKTLENLNVKILVQLS